MKILPKKDLIWLIQTTKIEHYSLDDIHNLFERYGDDYYVSEYNHSVLELTKENEEKG